MSVLQRGPCGYDRLKRKQLIALSIINGNYRPKPGEPAPVVAPPPTPVRSIDLLIDQLID